ncbi:hypothetical protein EYC84_004520 [Monilinia fructicola]|uniref:Uncharacterized protein n=1 Tax=Monilinia fructicola TaxID=38448 RepID=A0A5M9K0M4_MONFR|nr:hypothetical protein EYC84_004520 [Monilinia fructicola]
MMCSRTSLYPPILECNSHNTMEIIWQALVYVLSIIGWNKWCNNKVDIGEEEKTTPPAMWHGKAEPSVEDGDQPRMVERIG